MNIDKQFNFFLRLDYLCVFSGTSAAPRENSL